MCGQASAQIYTEAGDAGQTLGTAQNTGLLAGQPLTTIYGSLLSATDIDLFAINITAGMTFSATTLNTITGAQSLDTALFLFDSSGRPVYANDDANGLSLGSTLPMGNTFSPTTTGLYYLAISLSGSEPVNFANQLLFSTSGGDTTAIRGPNPIATGPLVNWDTSLVNGGGTTFPAAYEIDLTSSATTVPEPSTVALYVAGSLFLLQLRARRKQS